MSDERINRNPPHGIPCNIKESIILETAHECASLKAYRPDAEWKFDDLVTELANIIRRHVALLN